MPSPQALTPERGLSGAEVSEGGVDGAAVPGGLGNEVLFDILVNTFEMSAVKRPMGIGGQYYTTHEEVEPIVGVKPPTPHGTIHGLLSKVPPHTYPSTPL